MSRRLQLALFIFLLAVPFFWRLDAEEFHGDESHWITSGQQAFYLLTTGQLDAAQWRDEFYLYSQPQIGKLIIGLAVGAHGRYGPTAIYDYDWQRRPGENQATGRIPPPDAILAGRIPGAVAGWLGCLLLWALGAELGATGAGRTAAILLASHPLWLANARRAGLDTIALTLGLFAAWAVLRAAHFAYSWRRSLGWLLVAGITLGLAAGAKYVALLTLPVVAGAALLATRHRRGALTILGAAPLVLLLGGATFWLGNPTLYRDPIQQLGASVGFLTGQAQEMRRHSPDFSSPLTVAAEIVDRVVWPTGFPAITDRTLPEPLIPGSYGTPVVALGGAVALCYLLWSAVLPPARRSPFPTREGVRSARHAGHLTVVASWTAAVFILLALSLTTWWERWHLPLVLPLCLLAGMGLALQWPVLAGVVAAAQYVAALAAGPSYLGKGFSALIDTPWGAASHLVALAVTLTSLVVHFWRARAGLETA